MSNFKRNSPFANAAIVITVDHQRQFGDDLFGGLKFRQNLESQALKLANSAGSTRELPAQKLADFMEGKTKRSIGKTSCPSGSVTTPLHTLFQNDFLTQLRQSLNKFESKMKGFCSAEATLFGVESRTSCPVTIERNKDTLVSLSHTGLYPCGEGAGYAGGITSAACDGTNVADAIVSELASETVDSQT